MTPRPPAPPHRRPFVARQVLAGVVLALSCAVGAAQGTAPRKPAADTATPAKELFGRTATPADLAPQPIGFYARGCLAGARALATDGAHWQAMRPSRNRHWGHPALVGFLERFAARAAQASGWPGILVGDISQPRGGPMLTGHASHQIGLDADIWMLPMPAHTQSREEREQTSSIVVVRSDRLDVDPTAWTPAHLAVLRTAASEPQVQRIFVNAAIKRAACRSAKGEDWLRKLRPAPGHDAHFHVRLHCPEGTAQCSGQEAVPEGDGCDATLDWWFTPEALHPPPPKTPPPPPITLAGLPDDCRAVIGVK